MSVLVPQRAWLRVLLGALVLLALAAYVAPSLLYPPHPTPARLAEAMKRQAALQGPAKVWAATCAHCHAPAEGAPIGPSLHGRAIAPAAVMVLVRQGVRGMPAFRPSEISDEELAALAQFVHHLPAGSQP